MGGLRYHDKFRSIAFLWTKVKGESFFEQLEKLNKFVCAEWVRQGNKAEFYDRIGPIILVILDNASYHKRQDIIDKIEQMLPNIQLCFLPPYSPDFNLIELVWHSCKASLWEYPPSRLYVNSLLIGCLCPSTNFKKS
jgi:transposase